MYCYIFEKSLFNQPFYIMKSLFFFVFCLFSTFSFAYAQEQPTIKVGYSVGQAGNGDIPGHMFLMGVQKEISRWSMLEVLASGTYIEHTRDFGQGYQIHEKSNGVALEANYNLLFRLGRLTLYPSAGPVLRYAHEVNADNVGIRYDRGRIVDFEADIRDEKEFQLGYVLAANLDGRITRHITLGLRATVQSFHTGQRLAFVGLTFKNSRWRF